jgi:hypothetical protein
MVFPFFRLAPRPVLCWQNSRATETDTTRNFARIVSSHLCDALFKVPRYSAAPPIAAAENIHGNIPGVPALA